MLTEQELIAYLENTLPPAERTRVETELQRNPQLRRELVHQARLDAALRAALGSKAANQRVRASVLAVVRGEQEAAIKDRVLADVNAPAPGARSIAPRRTPGLAEQCYALLSWLRRPAFGVGFAAALVLFVVWFAQHPAIPTAGIELPSQVALAGAIAQPKLGDTIRAGTSTSATVKFADGTTLHLEPGTEINFDPVASRPRAGGKQLKLLAGSLSADVAKQPAGLPLLIQTPHALVTVVGTEFDLSVATNQTELEVTHGLVKMTSAGDSNVVSVAAGQFAVASPRGPMRYGRLARNPYLWPFSSASIWNRPLGSGAQYAPVPRSFLDEGPLQNAMRPRRPFLGSASDPLRRIWVNGEPRADIRLPGSFAPPGQGHDSIVLLQHARRFALELTEVGVRPDGGLDAADLERMSLNGPGIFPGATPAVRYGLSQLGGLLRAGELENGIRHALAARISRNRLEGDQFSNPATVWPAAGKAKAATDSFLSVGSLLAIPPDVDIKKLFGASAPAYELARAMQDYGVYVSGQGDGPFVLLAESARIPEADAWLNQLVPLLRVVTNNLPESPGGGGTPRRESAPALPGEAP